MFDPLYDVGIARGKLFNMRDLFHLLFPQTSKATGYLGPRKPLWMFQKGCNQGLHVSYTSKSHTPYPSSEPPGGNKPFRTSDYRRWCLICQVPRDTKGGHIRGGKFICGKHP